MRTAAGTATSAEAGNDTLASIENVIGGGGGDTFVASTVRNVLSGGLGADTFVFGSTGAAGTGTQRDQITDFLVGSDTINVSGIDATNAIAGDQAFVFAGEVTSVVGGLGQLARGQIGYRYEIDANGVEHTIVEGNINAALAADFQIDLIGRHVLSANDFVL